MDLGSLNQANQFKAASNGAYKTPDLAPPTTRKSEVVAAPVEIAAIPNVDIRSADQQRMGAARDALSASYKDFYAVSDRSFTIYKDSSGQLITRYTSLKDGKVTYIPEQEVMSHAPDTKPILSVNA